MLFLKFLPDFNDMLRPGDSELLLTYLTAPYLRVPLLLGFFSYQLATLLQAARPVDD